MCVSLLILFDLVKLFRAFEFGSVFVMSTINRCVTIKFEFTAKIMVYISSAVQYGHEMDAHLCDGFSLLA